jgi:hypothetical protein
MTKGAGTRSESAAYSLLGVVAFLHLEIRRLLLIN